MIRQRGMKYQARVNKGGIEKSKTFDLKRDAQSWIRRIESEIEMSQRIGYDGTTILADVIDRYIREVSMKKKGFSKEHIRLKRLAEYPFAQVKTVHIDVDDLSKWRDERLRTVKPSTVIREWGLLSAVFEFAIQNNLMAENLLKKVKKPRAGKARTRRYSDDEIKQLIFCSEFKLGCEPIYNRNKTGAALLFALETACRAGEIAKLKWEDVDLERSVILLRDTKNGEDRFVPLTRKAKLIIETMRLIASDNDPRVFQIESAIITNYFIRLKKEAGLENSDLTFHDSRREALSKLSKIIPDPKMLAKISGHKDLSMLLNHYYSPTVDDLVGIIQQAEGEK